MDALAAVRAALLQQEADRFRQEEPGDRQEHRRYHRAEHEDVAPVAGCQQAGGDRAADDGAHRIACRHDRHRQVAMAVVGELRHQGIGAGQHAADPQPGDEPDDREVHHRTGRRRHGHAARHDDEAGQHRRPPSDPVGQVAQRHRAHRHADQFHRQHQAEGGPVDPPFRGDARRGEADRQHVEPVKRIEQHAKRHCRDLQGSHRSLGQDGLGRQDGLGISGHRHVRSCAFTP